MLLLSVVGAGGMKLHVVGPKSELDKLRPKLESRWVFWDAKAKLKSVLRG